MGMFDRFKPPGPEKKAIQELREEDIEKIADQKKLAEIAISNGVPYVVSNRAIEKLNAKNNQDLLLRIAFDRAFFVGGRQGTAIKKLLELDQEVWEEAYAELARDNTLFMNDRTHVIRKLGEADKEKFQELFADIVRDTKGDSRSLALRFLDTDKYQDLLRERANDKSEENLYVRLGAAERFDPAEMQDVFIDIALADPGEMNYQAVQEAIKRIDPDTRGEFLMAIALTKNDPEKFRYTGEYGLAELAALATEILSKGNNTKKFLEAIAKTTTQGKVYQVANDTLSGKSTESRAKK